MTDLWHSLHKSDYSYLKIVAETWGIPFLAPDERQGVEELVQALLDGDLLLTAPQVLSEKEREALVWLDQEGGRAPWDQFTRTFGQVRQMGAGRLERDQPHKDPISPAEGLWYRALIGRGFFETEAGSQEFAYLPEDTREILLPLLNPERIFQEKAPFVCRVASEKERQLTLPASSNLLNHLCSLLAAARMDLDPLIHLPDVSQAELDFYHQLAITAELMTAAGEVDPDRTRQFLALDPSSAQRTLWQAWRQSGSPGELGLVPSLQLEGDIPVDHNQVREQVLGYLAALKPGAWWSMASFTAQVQERYPDFLRSGGDYEAWFIKRADGDQFLKGFQHWDDVEGALLRYFISGPLHWLGLVDLGLPEEGAAPLGFRIGPGFAAFSAGKGPALPALEPDLVSMRSQGEIRMTAAVPLKTRYQIARFCDWQPWKAEAYHYRISPGSLARAEEQGLRVPHLLSLLESHTEAIPPNILAALQRWEKQGTQAEIGRKLVLRVGSPAVLKSLKKSPAQRYIVEQLGPTVVIIRPGSQDKVTQALLELGFFSQIEDQSGSQI